MAVTHTGHTGVFLNAVSSGSTDTLTPSGSEGAVSVGATWLTATGVTLSTLKHGSGGTDIPLVTDSTIDDTQYSRTLKARGHCLAVGSTAQGVYATFSGATFASIVAHVDDGVDQATPAAGGFSASAITGVEVGGTPQTLDVTKTGISCAVGDMLNYFGIWQTQTGSNPVSDVTSSTGTITSKPTTGIYTRGGGAYDTADGTSETATLTGVSPSYYSGYPYSASYQPAMAGIIVGFVVQQSGGGGAVDVNPDTEQLELTDYNPSVHLDTYVNQTSESLVLTDNTQTVSVIKYTEVSQGNESLELTDYNPSVSVDNRVSPNVEALIFTDFSAGVTVEVPVYQNTESLLLTDYQANVLVDNRVDPNTESLLLTDYSHTVDVLAGTVVNQALEQLVLTDYSVSIHLDTQVNVNKEELLITDYSADVTAEVPSIEKPTPKGSGGGGRYYYWTPEQIPEGKSGVLKYQKSAIDYELERLLKLSIERENKAKQAAKIADKALESWDAVASIQRASKEVEKEIQRMMSVNKLTEVQARKKLKTLREEEDLILALLIMEVA